MMKKQKQYSMRRLVLTALLAGAIPFTGAAAGNTTVANTTLPSGGKFVYGEGTIPEKPYTNNTMNITQNGQNAVITWQDFSIGANATVNFKSSTMGGFNTLNYVTGGKASQIYGKMNAQNGNIYLVNPSGVQIGNSAQINVGSLYVSNAYLDETKFNQWSGTGIQGIKDTEKTSTAELMSLGHINAPNVVFNGSRIIIDMDRLNGNASVDIISRQDPGYTQGDYKGFDIVLGQSAKQENQTITFHKEDGTAIEGQDLRDWYSYQWIKNADELTKIENMSGHYALRNAIDLTGTKYTPIGTKEHAFKGKLDGLGNNIFGLKIEGNNDYAGLFGYTDGAIMGYFNLISGSEKTDITGNHYVGSLIGYAKNTKVKGVTSTLDVEGTTDVGGLVGHAENSQFYNVINTGTVSSHENAGGLIGSMAGGTLGVGEDQTVTDWETHNLGAVNGIGKETNPQLKDYSYNIGGLVGMTEKYGNVDAVIGSKGSKAVYNQAAVTGGYNVGGIVGSAADTKFRNVANKSTVTANGYTSFNYIFHTDYTKNSYTGSDGSAYSKVGYRTVTVKAANAGGIAGAVTGSTIDTAENTGSVQSGEDEAYKKENNGDVRYLGANVGGIAGMAENTNITDAKNRETNIRGAMNVGGIAGYFGTTKETTDTYAITNALNSGGDIMATGGIHFDNNDWVKEITRNDYDSNNNDEEYITGNIGGIAGYLYGDHVRITKSGNRGQVHTDLTSRTKDIAKAANAGGIVGKMDRATQQTLDKIENGQQEFTVSDSYNTGLVQGYVNIGGVAGFMYNGSIAGSYNEGAIKANRNAAAEGGKTRPINLGGIVGDTTERSSAQAILYNVFNKGELGDKNFGIKGSQDEAKGSNGRHIGGIAGRLSGVIDTAYNNGAIWNGYSSVGGITGYWYNGQISNVFNTGNITVYNQDTGMESAVGGLVGSLDLSGGNKILGNAYNLGAIRSFQGNSGNSVAGIIGSVRQYGEGGKTITIENVYTTGNLYAGDRDGKEQTGEDRHAIIGLIRGAGVNQVSVKNAVYVQPPVDEKDDSTNGYSVINHTSDTYDGTLSIDYANRYNAEAWNQTGGLDKLGTENKNSGNVDSANTWRIYSEDEQGNGTLPMLNAFLPKSEGYFSGGNVKKDGIDSIQYGTAYNPLLTIIRAKKDAGTLVYDEWEKLMDDTSSIAVYGAGLSFKNVTMTDGAGFYNGTIYADGALNLTGTGKDVLQFGGLSQLYGDSVTIDGGNQQNIIINGKVQALGTGNSETSGGIKITNAGSLDVYGKLFTSQKDENVLVPGVGDELTDAETGVVDKDKVGKKDEAMTDMGDRYGKNVTSKGNGDLTIDADSYVNINYGNLKSGETRVGGDISITSKAGDVFMDTDFTAGGTITMTGDKNLILDVSHLGGAKANSDSGTVEAVQVEAVQDFFKNYKDKVFFHTNKKEGETSSLSEAGKIAIDMWDSEKGEFNFNRFDVEGGSKLGSLMKKFTTNEKDGQDIVYVWVKSAEQLNGIQTYKGKNPDSNILSYNFAMKNDIDASSLPGKGDEKYVSIGSQGTDFTGTFDGLGNRIIGLKADGGIFGTIGKTTDTEGKAIEGRVKDVKIYSSQFKKDSHGSSVGAVAATNFGTISGITGLGNSVIGETERGSIGGLVGQNNGMIQDSTDQSTIIANKKSISGGIAGSNSGTITNVETNSAVTSNITGQVFQMGGIVGDNVGRIENVSAHGVTGKTGQAQTSGGIVGSNSNNSGKIGIIENAYNETVLHGASGLGGIAGTNAGTIFNVTNAVEVAGDRNSQYTGGETGAGSTNVGGLVGSQISGTIENGRNTGTVTGDRNVGGLVGSNAKDSTLTNLENGDTASVTGYKNVGGIAGVNDGTITMDDTARLINKGIVTGNTNVGGIAGTNTNTGIIENSRNETELKATGDNAQYFGGVAGNNLGIIRNSRNEGSITSEKVQYVGGISGNNAGRIENVTNTGEVKAEQGEYVGGITGYNHENGWIIGDVNNKGKVTGDKNVGGIAGINDSQNFVSADGAISTVLKNEGEVLAHTGGAGGIFYKNTANFYEVSMINTGNVTGGGDNVGGIIGDNSGSIRGGRDENDSYYKYQIYNNGTVEGKDKEGKATNDVGGLIGHNSGTLQAAYNTGIVKGDTSVGGIVGTNAGTVDQVFNTVMTKDGQNQTVAGSANVGGIVGFNTGKVSNAYNTTNVVGNGVSIQTGAIAGMNYDGSISNVYGTSKLLGSGKPVEHGYIIDNDSKWTNRNSYSGFDFTNNGAWKNYDGHTNPLLKVFLTKVTVAEPEALKELIASGRPLDVGQLIKDGILTAPKDANGYPGFSAYDGNHTLLQTVEHKETGTYSDWFYSSQIGSTGSGDTFNPNLLGYDIDFTAAITDGEFNPDRWNYLFRDAPWGRQWNWRERKAEIHFMDGAFRY